MKSFRKIFTSAFVGTALAAVSAIAGLSSCDRLHEDLQPCTTGIQLNFDYSVHLETGDVAYAQVDCLTLLVYNADGSHLLTKTFRFDLPNDRDWHLDLDLDPGSYHLVAWGGLDCDDASFSFTTDPSTTPMRGLEVSLDNGMTDKPLHKLFYGALDVTVPQPGIDTDLVKYTLYMKRDTNDLRILLANVNGEPTDEADYDFSLITDNTLLGWDNELLTAGETTYSPFARGNAVYGVTSEGTEASAAYAEISTSRFVYGNPTTLLITRRSDGKEVIRVPLLNLLLLYKSDRYKGMPIQEFFDSMNYWPITFFLTGDDVWYDLQFIVDDWVVRINHFNGK